MSLLDSGPDVLAVYVEVETTDDYGNEVMGPADYATEVNGRLQPSTAEESQSLGQNLTTTHRFISRTFPGGAFSHAKLGDREFEIIGQPKWHRGSPRTEHFTTYLLER